MIIHDFCVHYTFQMTRHKLLSSSVIIAIFWTVFVVNAIFFVINIVLHGFCQIITVSALRKTHITLGLLMIWQKPCNSLIITYLIVIFEVLLIKLWLFLSFFPRIITKNSCITLKKWTVSGKILIKYVINMIKLFIYYQYLFLALFYYSHKSLLVLDVIYHYYTSDGY